MRYLGIDLGSKTVGLAMSDLTGTIASTFKTIFFKNEDYRSTIDEIKQIVIDYDIKKIVIGLPKNMNNTLGERAIITTDYKKMLEGLSREEQEDICPAFVDWFVERQGILFRVEIGKKINKNISIGTNWTSVLSGKVVDGFRGVCAKGWKGQFIYQLVVWSDFCDYSERMWGCD